MMFLVVPTLSALNNPIFNGPQDYPVGGTPNSVVVADFNGDGRPDIATANQATNNVSVLLQNSNGTFQPAVNYAVGNGPASLQVGDVNNDGKLDLVVVNVTDGTIGVLLGNGDGSFQAQNLTTLSVTPLPNVVIGDFDGDGKLDVAVAVPTAQVGTFAAAVLLGNGDGTFQAPVNYAISSEPVAMVTADFNNDKKLDLAIAAGNGINVLLGNGDGTFQAPIITQVSEPDGLVVADFNLDGKPDIATESTAGSSPGLAILLGNGDGTFQVNVLSSFQDILPLAAGDINGDGKPDLVATTTVPSGVVEVLLNSGDGAFIAGQSLQTAAVIARSLPSVALSDLNGNQDIDLVVASPGTELNAPTLPDIVSVVYGKGDGTFVNFPSYPASLATPPGNPPGSVGTPVVGDFNGDGKPDLAVPIFTYGRNYSVEISTLLNDGEGFAPPIVTSPITNQGSSPLSPIYIVAGDFNGDGKLDVALTSAVSNPFNPPTGISILLGNGDGTFQTAATYGADMTGPIAIGDFNKDGKLDVIGVTVPPASSIGLSVLLGNGDGTFGFPVTTSIVGSIAAFAVADFNNDGKLDVAALVNASGSPELAMFFGKGDGTFTAGPTYSVGLAPTAIATGDMNGDGVLDLIVGNSVGFVVDTPIPSNVTVLLGNGNGTFQSPIVTTAGNAITSLAIADFNLDGKLDVVTGNTGWADISLLLGNGDGTLQPPTEFYFNNGFGNLLPYNALAVADFDGNGSPDIAVGGTADVSLLLNTLGTGGPGAVLSPNAIGFGSETVGQTSSSQAAALSNSGTAAISIAGIAITGAQNGDFQQTNNCGASLAQGANCTINITFSPQAGGMRTAAIQITDSAINSPQTVALTGTGQDFSITATSPSQTVSPGGTATYSLSVSPSGGFSQMVQMSCSGAPAQANCSVSPSSFTLNGSASQAVTVTVTTVGPSAGLTKPQFGGHSNAAYGVWVWWFGPFGMVGLLGFAGWGREWRRWVYGLLCVCVVAAAITFSGCGGSGGGGGGKGGIQPGSYNFMVTGTFSSGSTTLTNTTQLTLVVQ